MGSDALVFPPGSLIAFSKGSYSDYGFVGHVIARKKLDIPALIQACKDGHNPNEWGDPPGQDEFVAWLIIEGYAHPADVTEVHIGDYGELGT